MNAVDINNIPQELKSLPHWVLWRKELRDGKETKIPYQVNGQYAKTDNQKTWASLPCILQKLNGHFNGIGFQAGVEPCGNVLIDLDHCIIDGEIEPWARQIIGEANSYTEISPGGDGIHIFCGGKLPGASIKAPDAEIYDHKRYFTFTGRIENDRKTFRQLSEPEILKIYKQIEARKQKKAEPQKTTSPNSSISNKDLLDKIFHSKNGAAIERLYRGDLSGHADDQSSADLALCSHLAFWTNRNISLMNSLFRESDLYREKWDKKHSGDGRTYGEMTLQKAIEGCTQSIGDRPTSGVGGESRPENQPEPIEPWTLDTISVERFLENEPTEQEWVIPDFLPAGTYGIVSGEGGSSKKSMAMILLCIEMAVADFHPLKWLNVFPLIKKRSLYVSLEDSKEQVHRRISGIIKKLPFDALTFPTTKRLIKENFFTLCKEDFFSNGDFSKLVDTEGNPTKKFTRLKATLDLCKPDLVIIDTKAKASGVPENDNDLNSALMTIISSLINCVSNPTILLISHVSKAVRAGLENHSMNSVRGAGSIADDSRFILWFRPLNEKDADGCDLIEIIHAKNSYGKLAKKFTVAFDYPVFKLSELTPGSIAEEKRQIEFAETKKRVLKLLADNPGGLSQNKIQEKAKKRRDLIKEILAECDEITREGTGSKAKYVFTVIASDAVPDAADTV
ncbi:MAG: AAA family ATPase [Chitinivibrionales bacterium]|nr:AAA family ATPase [Chitinivibrionales bacterium]